MRQLVLLRGAMGAGKTTFIKENKLQQYVLSADDIRLLFQTPIMTETGKTAISAKNDGRVWKLLMELLEERMKRGEFTIIDATHAKQEMIAQYKSLAQRYRYRVNVLDFSDVPLETLLEQNRKRDEHKHVPEHVIMNAHQRMQTEHVPKWVNLVKPNEYHDTMRFSTTDYSDYKRIHHIGDVQGCFDALMNYFHETGHTWGKDGEVTLYPNLNDDELYIFVGDMLDRGIQNAEVLKFFLHICERKNVAIVEGNHEIHLWNWANDEKSFSKEFVNYTQPQLEDGLSEEEIVELKKAVRQLYRRLRQLVYYTYKGKKVIVTHGGLSKLPENLIYISTHQFINGVGDYEVDIDNHWDENLPYETLYAHGGRGNPRLIAISMPKKVEIYQIHGHRNIFRLPVQAGEYSFNLEGQVEFGGHLRAVTLTDEGFETHEIKNHVFKIRKGNTPKTIDEDISMEQFIEYLANHKEIIEKDLGGNIYSYNFSRDAFRDKNWDDINVKARGLFINKNTKEIVSRSYNKFFNVNERSFTKLNALADNLVFPVQVYDKPNGYLGTVGYDSESDSLIFTSKSTNQGDHAGWLKELFVSKLSHTQLEAIKHDLKDMNVALVFEVIKAKEDPHIIEYTSDNLVLLDVVNRTVQYGKLPYIDVVGLASHYGFEHKKLMHTFDNWTEFYYWYRDVTADMSIKDEGFVIEDAAGFMTKIKLPYYNFWKQFRSIKDKFAKRHEHTVRGGSLYTPLHNKVFKWMKGQDGHWLKENNIIAVRKAFDRDQSVKDA
ncbi:RNA ligase [Paenibacillus agilis]|uniref:AAA family ATPase n=1 Tax=Paenibacillus agilis TaxID=3020863 RepID=A0A559IED1_9BACL|nr:RNA ligase [Paenibacillus agilis]TVX86014.1 AAA family ATPase [Paenibacillus agilis]